MWTNIFLVLSLIFEAGDCTARSSGRCELMTVPICKDLGYQRTFLDTETQEEVGLELHQFYPLIKMNCSKHLAPFLCSAYLPECYHEILPILPCKSLCKAAKRGCKPIMNSFGFDWPENLRCNRFPETNCRGLSGEFIDEICQELDLPMCQDQGYNRTHQPNSESQPTTAAKMQTFAPLIKVNCSVHLKPLLCRAHAPECSEENRPIYPCRSVCEEAKTGCEPVMRKFGFRWPEILECSRFPQTNCKGKEEQGSGNATGSPTENAASSDTAESEPQLVLAPIKEELANVISSLNRLKSMFRNLLSRNGSGNFTRDTVTGFTYAMKGMENNLGLMTELLEDK